MGRLVLGFCSVLKVKPSTCKAIIYLDLREFVINGGRAIPVESKRFTLLLVSLSLLRVCHLASADVEFRWVSCLGMQHQYF